MNRLVIEGTDYTPTIEINPKKQMMLFSGVSRPENVGLFFQQVLDWMADFHEYISNVGETYHFKVIFRLDYCNSPTQKYLITIIEKLMGFGESIMKFDVDWFYESGDDKMLEDGEDIADALGIHFNFKEFN